VQPAALLLSGEQGSGASSRELAVAGALRN